MKQLSIGAVLLALCTAACVSATLSDPDADRQAVAAASARFQEAENASAVDQMSALFADDLVMMGPNMPSVTGIDEVVPEMSAFHAAIAVDVEYDSQEIEVFGDWAFDRGTYSYTLTPRAGGASFHETGKYLWLYRRQADGSWKQARVIWNSSDPPPSGGV